MLSYWNLNGVIESESQYSHTERKKLSNDLSYHDRNTLRIKQGIPLLLILDSRSKPLVSRSAVHAPGNRTPHKLFIIHKVCLVLFGLPKVWRNMSVVKSKKILRR